MDYINHWGSPIVIFGFVVLIVLINGIFAWLRESSRQETLREAIRNGVDIDPVALKEAFARTSGDSRGGRAIGGLVLLAVGTAMLFFGYQIGQVEGDDEILMIFTGISAFPFLIGTALLVSSLFGGKSKQE